MKIAQIQMILQNIKNIQKDKKGINKNIYLPKKNSIILKKQKINNDNQVNKCC